jgi:transposase
MMSAEEGLRDARKIPNEVMNYVRRLVVRAVEEKHQSPELVAEIFGISRSSVYEWLRRYRAEGEAALDTRSAPGAVPVITAGMDQWLRETILSSTPQAHGYDTVLWSCPIVVELLKQRYGIEVSVATVRLHLHDLKLSSQVPSYQARQQDAAKVERFVTDIFPRIQRLAQKMGADIGFEDEAGVGIRTRAGRTWGEVGHPPQITVSEQRGGYNVLSIISAEGELRYSLEEKSIDGARYVEFLRQGLHGRTRPLIVIADRARFHTSTEVRRFVRAHRRQIRMFFFPPYSPELNPDEQVWNEIKHRQLGRQPLQNKADVKIRLRAALQSLQHKTERIRSFFQLPNTQYAAMPAAN